MNSQTILKKMRLLLSLGVAIFLSASLSLKAQGPMSAQEPPTPVLAGEESQVSPTSPCLEPPPLIRLQDYDGPFSKIAASFARKLDRKTVHPPHYKPGARLCSLEPKDKFLLFVHDGIDPFSFLNSGFNAGINQATNQDPSFGQGAIGYGKRFGADLAGQTASRFFGDFLYPTIFSEDPRYYRMGHGGTKQRLMHAMRHTFVGHRDDSRPMFNFTEWMGTASSVALNNLYHPGNKPGVGPAAWNGASSILQDMGFDVLREFWPEIARKFRLPFRARDEPAAGN
jgi:hypothetical protein